MNRLPEKIVARGVALAEGATYYGVPLSGMTREELLAVAALCADSESRARQEGLRRARFVSDLVTSFGGRA